jgi:hypothetical protein
MSQDQVLFSNPDLASSVILSHVRESGFFSFFLGPEIVSHCAAPFSFHSRWSSWDLDCFLFDFIITIILGGDSSFFMGSKNHAQVLITLHALL